MGKLKIKRRCDYQRQDGQAALYGCITVQSTSMRIPVGVSASPAEWDDRREIIRGRGKEVDDRNLIISNFKAKVSDIMVRARLTGEKLTPGRFRELLRADPETDSFVEFARNHLDQIKSSLQWETYRHHIISIDKFAGKYPDARFCDITPELLRVYAAYLRDTYHNAPGTIAKNISILRTHFFAAMRMGKVNSNPFEVYKLPQSYPSVVFLTEEELDRLIALFRSDTLRDEEQTTLRFFLFMCFTGMHISDARSLRIEQIYDGEIHYVRRKTGVPVHLPMSEPTLKLVEWYREGRMKGNLFNGLPTDQSFNRLIKIVSSRADIRKNVSAKTGRHTFATLYYRLNNGDVGTLSKLLGHTSVRHVMVYAHILRDSRVSGIAAFDGML